MNAPVMVVPLMGRRCTVMPEYISVAIDGDGDIWRKYDDELWQCVTDDAAKLTKNELIEYHGPLLMMGGCYRIIRRSI
jgi:hypothetical protein